MEYDFKLSGNVFLEQQRKMATHISRKLHGKTARYE